MRTVFTAVFLALIVNNRSVAWEEKPLPKVAEGWSVEVLAQAPSIAYPTAVVVAPDGTTYLGQDPMDMPGPPTVPADSVVAIRDGKITKFADKLWAVMGLEWADGTLFVVHAPYLSAFRDSDGDGKADSRVDLVTGLGPKIPGFNGINDHIASGIRLGIDGFLYVSVGDKGLPKATGRDGATITMASGGVIRVRPDGTGLEVVSTGERNPLSVALTSLDEIFTYGNDDDSKKWPNSLTHHIVGGHYGYPYEFLTAPFRALPIVDGQIGGSGAQGICYNEDGLPGRFRGNLFFCDWGLQKVFRYEVAPEGATFKVIKKEPLVERGELTDFRPFSIATAPDGASLILVDWAYNGWLADGPPTGRLYRLTYTGADRLAPGPRPAGDGIEERLKALDHPALSVRRQSQRILASKGAEATRFLIERLDREPEAGRIQALWALHAIGSDLARQAIRSKLVASNATIQAQAARSAGISGDKAAVPGLIAALRSPDPIARRESAIALGKIGGVTAGKPLYAALGDSDPVVSWSIRQAIRKLEIWDPALLTSAFADPQRREDALKLADESWSIAAIRALNATLEASADPGWKTRAIAALAGNYRRYPEWSGQWFGTNPLAGAMPRKTRDWDAEAMQAVIVGLVKGLKDADPLVRRAAIVGLATVGERASPLLRLVLDQESDPINLAASAQALGTLRDLKAIPGLGKLLLDASRPVEPRVVALDVLASLNNPQALTSRLTLVYDAKVPEVLLARALPALGKSRVLPANDLSRFLDNPSEAVRAAALQGFPTTGKALPVYVKKSLLSKLDDPSPLVRNAAIQAVREQKLAEAIPRLIALAARDECRASATLALAEMPDARAFAVYVEALGDADPATRNAGEIALKQIRDEVSSQLESLARQGKFVGRSALSVERVLTRFQPVVDWRVIGPFPRTTPLLFADSASIDVSRNEVGAEGKVVSWQARAGDPITGRVVIDDFKAGAGDKGGFGYDVNGSPDLAAFALTEIKSDRDRPALLMVRSSGSILVTVNNQPVLNFSDVAGRAYSSDSESARISLKRGVNRILVRSRQGIGLWSFGLMLSEPSSPLIAGQEGSVTAEGLRAFALTHSGDPINGERIFFETKGVGCVRCHAVGQQGSARIGPDLTGLASKYQKEEIIRSVLEPSNRLATGYQPLLIAKHDGTVATGMLKAETDDSVELSDADGQTLRIGKFEIDQRKVSSTSLMPAGLVDALSPVEFADLIAYLGSLKGTK